MYALGTTDSPPPTHERSRRAHTSAAMPGPPASASKPRPASLSPDHRFSFPCTAVFALEQAKERDDLWLSRAAGRTSSTPGQRWRCQLAGMSLPWPLVPRASLQECRGPGAKSQRWSQCWPAGSERAGKEGAQVPRYVTFSSSCNLVKLSLRYFVCGEKAANAEKQWKTKVTEESRYLIGVPQSMKGWVEKGQGRP